MLDESRQVRVLIISGDKSRRDQLEKSLKNKPEISIEIIPSVDGYGLSRSSHIYSPRAFEWINKRPAVQGEIGCYLAHQNSYKTILENKWDWCLILEDNARIEEEKFVSLMGILQSLVTNRQLSVTPTVLHLIPIDGPIYVSERTDLHGVFHCLSIPRRTKAYFMNYAAAAVAINEGLPMKDVADWPHWIRKVNFLVSHEKYFTIDQSIKSVIGERAVVAEPMSMMQKAIS